MGNDMVDRAILNETKFFLLECLERFANIEVSCFCEDTFYDVREYTGFNPVREDAAYRKNILDRCLQQDIPVIFVDEYHVAYSAIKYQKADTPMTYFLIGPIALQPMDKVTLHRFYKSHGLKHADEKPVPVLSSAKMILLIQLASGLILNQSYSEKDLSRANDFNRYVKQAPLQDRIHFSMEEEEQEFYHHTYQDERRLLDCVRNGQTEDAIKLNLLMDDRTGSMSRNRMEQIRKTVIVAITLNTRAAIEGGIPPYEAYQISDFYIQKMDQCNTEAELMSCKNEAIRTLSDRVQKRLNEKKTSNYIENCVSYIGRHYREHIYLDDLAEKAGITPTYLSRLFSQEIGMTFQEYVLKVRVDRAANLLTYSEASIAEIGDYVNFPNQSYFGRIFKKYKGMTPKAFRDRYKPREFNQ